MKDKWLNEILCECKQKSVMVLQKLKEQPFSIRMELCFGEQTFFADMNLTKWLENFMYPVQLLERSFAGVDKVFGAPNLQFQKGAKVTGYSGVEYLVPYYLEDKNRIIIIEPAIWPTFIEAFGFTQLETSGIFSSFMATEFAKYIDILNGQKKPTIMAFYGITDISSITEVNLLDCIKDMFNIRGIPTSREEFYKILKEKQNVTKHLGMNIETLFKSYGIPRFDIKLKDALRMSILDLTIPENKREIIGYQAEIGIPNFINPPITHYPLYAVQVTKKIDAEKIGTMLQCSTTLGHIPSESRLLPHIKIEKALMDPHDLMEYMYQQGLVKREMRGIYAGSPKGYQLSQLEIVGKPSESALRKVWNFLTKSSEFIPFLKFLEKLKGG